MTLLQNLKKPNSSFLNAENQSGIGLLDTHETGSFKSFEEVYKSSYSHGLESIYALENIDIKSVRRIASPTIPLKSSPKYKKKKEEITENQLEFDFGDSFRNWLDSFILIEPIHSLKLTAQAEKLLISNDKKIIKDLLAMDDSDYLILKGMGQGHIDEIKTKLTEYIDGQNLYHCRTVNFTALLRSLIGSLDKKKCSVALEEFDLSHILSFTSPESIELRHLTSEKKIEWKKEILAEFQSKNRKDLLENNLKTIVNSLIKPWIFQRNKIASQEEIEERLLRICEDCEITNNILNFISSIYFDKQFPVKNYLISIDENLYSCDQQTAQSYRLIVHKAFSYFYQPNTIYNFHELVSWIEKEFAMEWFCIENDFVAKVLEYSPAFFLRKNEKHVLTIKLA